MITRIPYPEKWEEIFRKIESKDISLPDASKRTGIPQGTLYNLVKQYRKDKEDMEKWTEKYNEVMKEKIPARRDNKLARLMYELEGAFLISAIAGHNDHVPEEIMELYQKASGSRSWM